jgi:hypothetical protein
MARKRRWSLPPNKPTTPSTPKSPVGSGGLSQRESLPLAILGIVVGVGFAMIPLNFWVGIAISAISELLLLIALFILVQNRRIRMLSIASAIIAYSVIVFALWVPNSIAPLLASDPGNYPKDTEIYGIKWQLNFSELTLVLDNRSDNDLTNLDIYVRTDLTIVAVGMAPGINTCSSEPYMPVAIASARVTQQGGEANQNDIPLLKGHVSASVYRLRG